VGFHYVYGNVFQILLGRGEAAVADVLMDQFRIHALAKLVGNKGVAEVVDLGVLDAGFFEIAVNGGTDIAYQQRTASFGYKQVRVGDFGPNRQVILDGDRSGTGYGDSTGGIVFQDADMDFVFADIFNPQICQFGDSHTCLEEELYDGGNPDIQPGSVAKGLDLGGCQDMRRFSLIFGVGEGMGGVFRHYFFPMKELKKSFQGIDFAADTLGSVILRS